MSDTTTDSPEQPAADALVLLDPTADGLDIDQLDAATRGLGVRFADAIGQHVKADRATRQAYRDDPDDPHLTVGEVAPLVVTLAHAADVLDRVAGEFTKGAAAARDFIGDEALSTGSDRLTVPDGNTRIVVSPATKAVTWAKPDELATVAAADLSRDVDPEEFLAAADGDMHAAIRRAHEAGARVGFLEVEKYGTVSWGISKLKRLMTDLLARAEYDLATAVEKAAGRKSTPTGDLTVKREAVKPGSRR